MKTRAAWHFQVALALCVATALYGADVPATGHAPLFPAPLKDIAPPANHQPQNVVFAGGCFWGVESIFEHVKGVMSAVSGYSGGSKSTAVYRIVGAGGTGHAEAVRVTYDPSQISFGQLLQVFFLVVHDPTQVDGQGPDSGTQYRSILFYQGAEQQQVAAAYIQQINAAKIYPRPIATQLQPLAAFYQAEDFHQHFAERNPNYAYVVNYDLPRLKQLQRLFPGLWKGGR